MQALKSPITTSLRPPRLNVAGACMHCLERQCDSARCIATHARIEWVLCQRCGGTEYVNGHLDPETATTRCNCFGGVIDADAADVVPVPVPLVRKSERGSAVATPHVVTASGRVFYAGF